MTDSEWFVNDCLDGDTTGCDKVKKVQSLRTLHSDVIALCECLKLCKTMSDKRPKQCLLATSAYLLRAFYTMLIIGLSGFESETEVWHIRRFPTHCNRLREPTPCRFVCSCGMMSLTVRCTRTPPIIRKHFRSGSSSFTWRSVSKTSLPASITSILRTLCSCFEIHTYVHPRHVLIQIPY